jgi:hypothetical protein
MVERGIEGSGAARFGLPSVAFYPGLLGVIGLAMSSSRMTASATFAATVALTLLAHIGVVHRTAPRSVIMAAAGALVWAVPVAIGDAMALGSTLVDVQEHGPKCGNGVMGLVFVVGPIGLVMLLGAAVTLSFIAQSRALDFAIHQLARIAAAFGVIVVAVSLLGLGREDPDTYFDTFPRQAVLEEGQEIRLGGHVLRYEHVQIDECRLIGVAGALPPNAYDGYPMPLRCPNIGIFLDPRGDLAIVKQLDQPSRPTIAFRVADAVALRLTVSDLGDRLAAPIGWRIGGAASVFLALSLLVAAGRIRRRAGALAGRDALHHGGGWVGVAVACGEGMAPVLCPVAASLPIGPIVLFGEQERPATYREVPVPSFRAARAGSLEASRVSLHDLAAALAAIALAVVVFGVTPLVVARFYGL